MKVFTTVKLTQNREMTPEGYMLCRNAVLARTGEQIYGPGETPVKPGPDGRVRISRSADELFSDKTMASFNGKPLIRLHPRTPDGQLKFVDAASWKDLSGGILLNVRRGQGADDDLLLGDILVTDEQTIRLVRGGKPELSLGYDCDYFADPDKPGFGLQKNILGNHVAIVPAARCGSRCSIGDEADINQERPVKQNLVQRIAARLAAAFQSGNESDHSAALQELQATPTGDERTADCGAHEALAQHQQAFNDHAERNDAEHADFHRRLEALEGRNKAADDAARATADAQAAAARATADQALEARIVVETGAEAAVVKAATADSKLLAPVFQAAVSGAEVLKPGLQAPTFDEAAKPADTLAAIDGLRRKAVDAALDDPDTRAKLEAMAGGKKIESAALTVDEIRTTFNAAVALRKERNNAAPFKPATITAPAGGKKAPRSIADLNRLHAEHFGTQH